MRIEKGRSRTAALALTGLLLIGGLALVWLRRRPEDTQQVVRQLWAQQGVKRPNVVLVTLDTTRADRLGCYGYAHAKTPNIDALARGGVLFANAASTAPLTQPAHSSIMTGMYPTHHGVRVNGSTALSQEQKTMAEALAEQGYDTGAFIGAFVLDGRWGLNQGFEVYDDHFDLEKYKHLDLGGVQRPADQVMDAALAWLENRQQDPFFAWIHLYDAHTPYEPPEPFLSEYRPRGLAGLYDGEIAFADQQLGRLLSWLQGRGLDKKTVLVVIGDHGEGLGSHGEGTHGYFVYDYVMHVPFLVATPFRELRGVRVDSQVSAVDAFPTVLALAGIDAATKVHGRSLLPVMFQPRTEASAQAYGESLTPNLQFGWSPLHSLRSTRYKLIKAPRPELYDLSEDPEETTNVFERRPAVARDLMQDLERLIDETGRGAPTPETADLDKETLERLAALGYVGTAASRTGDTSQPLADPKDKLGIYSAVLRAGELIAKDQHAAAAENLEAALREEPRMPQALLMLGASYAELGRNKEAKAQFDLVLKDDPHSVQALIGMASLLLEEGRTDDVITLCKQTLSLDERNAQAHTLLGEVYAGQEKPGEALPHFEKAMEIQPKLTRIRLNLAGCLTELEQYGRAEALLKEIIKEHPRFPFAQFNLGLLYEGQGRLEQARSAYAAEVSAQPLQFKARFNLGKVLFKLGDQAGSLEQMREVTRIAPKQPEGYLFLARGLLQQSAPIEDVQVLVEKGLSLARTPDLKALGWLLLADVFNRKRQPEKMNEALRKANSYMPGRSESRHATREN